MRFVACYLNSYGLYQDACAFDGTAAAQDILAACLLHEVVQDWQHLCWETAQADKCHGRAGEQKASVAHAAHSYLHLAYYSYLHLAYYTLPHDCNATLCSALPALQSLAVK